MPTPTAPPVSPIEPCSPIFSTFLSHLAELFPSLRGLAGVRPFNARVLVDYLAKHEWDPDPTVEQQVLAIEFVLSRYPRQFIGTDNVAVAKIGRAFALDFFLEYADQANLDALASFVRAGGAVKPIQRSLEGAIRCSTAPEPVVTFEPKALPSGNSDLPTFPRGWPAIPRVKMPAGSNLPPIPRR